MSRKGRNGRVKNRSSEAPGTHATRPNGNPLGIDSQAASPPGAQETEAVSVAHAEPGAGLGAVPAVAAHPEPQAQPASEGQAQSGSHAEQARTGANEDSSYPPVDLDTDFFASAARAHSDLSIDLEERDPRLALKLTPGVAHRRKQLAKYVKIAVGLSSALCLAALVKVAVAGHAETQAPRKHAVAQPASPPPAVEALAEAPAAAPAIANVAPPTGSAPAADPPVATAEAPAESPPAQQAPAQEPPAQQPPAQQVAEQAAASATAASAAKAPGAASEQPSSAAPDPEQAQKAKSASRVALEHGRMGAAIEAGERAVALDPADGEAWLILGAAYQEKGNAKEARRCYKACVEQGKRGPRGECGAMLR